MIAVTLQTISGDQAELEVNGNTHVELLMQRVESLWNIPPMCLQLAVGHTLLGASGSGDYEKLNSHCQPGGALSVSVLISFAEVECALQADQGDQDPDWHSSPQRQALRAVTTLGERVGVEIIPLVARQLQSLAADVRQLAVVALGAVAGGISSRSRCAVSAVMPYLRNTSSDVRCAVIQALGVSAEQCDQGVIAAVSASLEDESSAVKCAALHTLGRVGDGQKYWRQTVAKVLPCLQDPDGHIRNASVNALCALVVKGHKSLISKASVHLGNADAGIRASAVMLLGNIAEPGDRQIIAALASSCEDDNWYVRRVAVDALGIVADNGDERAIAAVGPLLADRDDAVRYAAQGALRVLKCRQVA